MIDGFVETSAVCQGLTDRVGLKTANEEKKDARKSGKTWTVESEEKRTR